MFKLSKLTDYATVIMAFMAKQPQQVYAARDIAKQTHIALPTVSKILKVLTQQQLLSSARGAKGGYSLINTPSAISLMNIIDAMEPPFGLTECSENHSHCNLEAYCSIRSNWQFINIRIRHALQDICLSDLIVTSSAFNHKFKQLPLRVISEHAR